MAKLTEAEKRFRRMNIVPRKKRPKTPFANFTMARPLTDMDHVEMDRIQRVRAYLISQEKKK